MSPADHLALAARLIGRALDVMDADPDNACRAMERLRDHLCVWAAVAKVVELELASKQAELEDSQLELEELEAEMTALLAENETGGEPAGPGDLAPVDPAELVGVTVEELAEGIPTAEELIKLLADPTEIETQPGNRPGKPKDSR